MFIFIKKLLYIGTYYHTLFGVQTQGWTVFYYKQTELIIMTFEKGNFLGVLQPYTKITDSPSSQVFRRTGYFSLFPNFDNIPNIIQWKYIKWNYVIQCNRCGNLL